MSVEMIGLLVKPMNDDFQYSPTSPHPVKPHPQQHLIPLRCIKKRGIIPMRTRSPGRLRRRTHPGRFPIDHPAAAANPHSIRQPTQIFQLALRRGLHDRKTKFEYPRMFTFLRPIMVFRLLISCGVLSIQVLNDPSG